MQSEVWGAGLGMLYLHAGRTIGCDDGTTVFPTLRRLFVSIIEGFEITKLKDLHASHEKAAAF